MPKTKKIHIDKYMLERLIQYQLNKDEICSILKLKFNQIKKYVKEEYNENWKDFYEHNLSMAKHLDKSNQKTKNPEGRPRKFKTVEDLQEAVDAYFDSMDEQKRPYTMTGLTLALGFKDRRSLLDYKSNLKFRDAIIVAKTRVENYYEEALHWRDKGITAGLIFGLKANFGWKESSVTEIQPLDKDGKPTDPTPPPTIINKTYINKTDSE